MIPFKKFFLFLAFVSISSNISAQSINNAFIESLPDSIKNDVLNQINTDNLKINQTKEYESFKTSREIDRAEYVNAFGELDRFGDEFFFNMPTTFMPINDPAAASGYILDVDDLILIQMLGDKSQTYEYRIDRAGNVLIPNVGFLNIAGLSIEKANLLFNQKLKDSFVNTEAIITLKEVRDIQVLITGQLRKPGVYILNGYSSILHALNSAGGLDKYGSFRKIELNRGGKTIKTFDLYDLFIDGNNTSDVSLRSGDTLLIKSTNNFVPVMGAVNREAIYEFVAGETINDAIKFSNGFSILASPEREIILIRESEDGVKSLDISQADLDINLQKGDRLFVKYKKYQPNEYYLQDSKDFSKIPVKISGAVKKPGEYFVDEGSSLYELIKSAGGYRENAYPFAGVFTSIESKILEEEFNKKLYEEAIKSLASIASLSKGINLSTIPTFLEEFKNTEAIGRVITEFDLEKISSPSSQNPTLSPGDEIYIPYFKNRIHVLGEVLNPGTLVFDEELSLKEFINLSGGLNKFADNQSITIIHPNGEAVRAKYSFFANSKYKLYAGSVIYVPRDLSYIDGIDLAAPLSQIFSSLAISLASINSISN